MASQVQGEGRSGLGILGGAADALPASMPAPSEFVCTARGVPEPRLGLLPAVPHSALLTIRARTVSATVFFSSSSLRICSLSCLSSCQVET